MLSEECEVDYSRISWPRVTRAYRHTSRNNVPFTTEVPFDERDRNVLGAECSWVVGIGDLQCEVRSLLELYVMQGWTELPRA